MFGIDPAVEGGGWAGEDKVMVPSFLVTGGAGFIGSNIAEALVSKGIPVRVLDNFSSGKSGNLDLGYPDFMEVLRGDIRDIDDCRKAVKGIRYVFHHAALVSVPESVQDPRLAHDVNILGTLNMLLTAREAGVKRFILSSSSAVYGDEQELFSGEDRAVPKGEFMRPRPLSPYGVTKLAGEEFCRIFYQLYGLETVSLRYFNVFGPRQDPSSAYGAVIPKFITALLEGNRPVIFGDGLQTRDFIFVEDIVRANLHACYVPQGVAGKVFNIARGKPLNLIDLLKDIREILRSDMDPVFADAREGDIRHSHADTGLSREILGFEPLIPIRKGLEKTIRWYELKAIHERKA